MKIRFSVIGLLLCCHVAWAGNLPRVTPESVGMSSERLKNADAAIEQAIKEGRTPGAVLAVVRHGKMAYLKAYGNRQVYPEKKPMTVQTVFDLASCSKPMSTATCAMILMERGQLRTLDAVNTIIPNFRSWSVESKDSATIRVVNLFTHTSGLPSYAPVAELKAKYGSPNPAATMDYIATCKRDFKPGTGSQYSCLNYITLQNIVEKLAGKSLRDFATEQIFKPLGMEHTDYLPCKQNKKGLWVNTDSPRWLKEGTKADGENYPIAPTERQDDGSVLLGQVHDPLARVMNGGVSGNAGLFSTADDIAVFCAMLQNGGEWNGQRVLSPLAVKAMRTIPHDLMKFGRTLGWVIYSPYASNAGDLLSQETYGHTGYSGTSILIDPVNDISIILLTNCVHPVDKSNVIRLRALVSNAVAGSVIK